MASPMGPKDHCHSDRECSPTVTVKDTNCRSFQPLKSGTTSSVIPRDLYSSSIFFTK